MEIPLCYRFDPTDEEIILHYLYNKTHGFPLSSSSAVIECDLYDETDGWKKFFEATRETTLYFFTKLRKKSEKGSRAERATGSGTWRSQSDKDLYNGGDRRQPIGYKRSFTFIPKKTAEKGKWVMKEYRLHESLLMNKKSDLVFCRIKKKVTKEERSTSKLTINNNSGNFVGGELIVSGFQEGMNMGALEVEKSDYVDDNNQSLTVEDVEVMKMDELGFTMEEIEGGSNQNQECYCYTYDFGGNYNVNSENPVSGEQNDYTYIIDSNQGVTMEEIDMVGSNNQSEHMQECYIFEANGGNSVNSKNCLDGENIVSGISEETMIALAETDDYIANTPLFTMADWVNRSCDQNIMEHSSTSFTLQHGVVTNVAWNQY